MKNTIHAQNLSEVLEDEGLSEKEFQGKHAQKEVIDFWGELAPESFVHRLPPTIKKAVLEIPAYLLLMSEDELERRLDPDELTSQMRIAFWDQYEVMQLTNKKTIHIEAVHANICSKEFFYRFFLKDHKKMAWMLKPPPNYDIRAKSLLDLGYRQMAKVLRMPLQDAKGKVDHTIIEKMLKITMMLDQRVKGAVIQKMQVHQKTENVHHHTREAIPSGGLPAQSELEKIERELLELRGAPKLVTVSESDE